MSRHVNASFALIAPRECGVGLQEPACYSGSRRAVNALRTTIVAVQDGSLPRSFTKHYAPAWFDREPEKPR
ncbi:hypothetical protein ABTC72_19780, partial [Acinetobacter baumannii]